MSPSAKVEQAAMTKAPMLSPGNISPEVLRQWERGCCTYFYHKDIEASAQIQAVAWGFQDTCLQSWFSVNQASFTALSFDDFVNELKVWMEPNWEICLSNELLNARQSPKKDFYSWFIEIASLNLLLDDTDSHLDDGTLRHKLASGLCEELMIDVCTEGLSTTLSLCDWSLMVKHLDERRLLRLHRIRKEAEHITSSRSNAARPASVSSARPTSTLSSATTCPVLPRLTDGEKMLLRAHEGCYKCRCFYARHVSNDCTVGFPKPETYKALTDAMAIAACDRRKAPAGHAPTSGCIAAVLPMSEDPSAMIGNGTDSEDEIQCINAPLPALYAESLLWNCLADGPAVDEPASAAALIDDGSQFVLIRDSLISHLGLRRRPLPHPISLGSAFSGGGEELSVDSDDHAHFDPLCMPGSDVPALSVSTHWVKLSCSSPDMFFCLCTVCALIAPDSLAYPIILGLPFLASNLSRLGRRQQRTTQVTSDDGSERAESDKQCSDLYWRYSTAQTKWTI
ncbi:hypothetical protein EWM64_g7307 [Hericium alpestre]|uniref:Uncharacterized protein n=1 Tax=Hericium alpestre TaxID=135208 RepID=A0A4Y9ZR21_9AGAM|nr:hypothetical protein EWM64_g7307 [Hericium alpestre]